MKLSNKIFANILLAGILFFSTASFSQVLTPQTSPRSQIEQVVGLTKVELDYSRPNVKGRLIFGDLVPYGRVWRMGANENTVISFADDVQIQGKTLKKGSYALYSIPKVEQWEIIFYKDIDNWGVPEIWDQSKVALSATVKVESIDQRKETFTIGINDLNIQGATLDIMWENTLVSLPFSVPTNELAMQSIEKTMDGPSIVDYYSAAEYYYASNQDANKALQWIDQAILKSGDNVPYYFVRLKSQILARLDLKQQAIQVAQQALELAKQANNLDYIKLNQESIKLWSSQI
ncbi:DUF2911 domain-containing protein [Myroides sp. LJL119]